MCSVSIKKYDPGPHNIIEVSHKDICSFLLRKLKHYHPETYYHSVRVSSLCAELFDRLGVEKKEQETKLRSALLHDIGKIKIDINLLNKQGSLNNEEWRIMKQHCRNGFDILHSELMKDYVDPDIILYHHENLDGTGYYGLMSDKLSLGVRIIRVADSYDAMTYPRAYSKEKSSGEAIEELYRWSGIHYDPDIVDLLYEWKNKK